MRLFLYAAVALSLAACGEDQPPTAVTADGCQPWVEARANQGAPANVAALRAKAPDICACLVDDLNKEGALSAADKAAVTTYFSVFKNPVKRDPAYGHISQDGRKALSGGLKQCAAKSGLDLE